MRDTEDAEAMKPGRTPPLRRQPLSREWHAALPRPLRASPPPAGPRARRAAATWAAAAAAALCSSLGLAGSDPASAHPAQPASAAPQNAAPIHVRDDAGHTVELPAPARRAVVLAPHAVELAYEAGAGAYVVGSVPGSDYPPEAHLLPQVGDGLRPDPERVAALRPDLLIAWQAGALRTLAPVLQAHALPVYYSDPRTLDDIPIALERFGALFGTQDVANRRAQDLRERLDALTRRYATRAPLRVFVQAGANPLYALGDAGIIGDVLRRCGAVNVFADQARAALQVSVESVLARHPDAIVAGASDAAEAAELRRIWQGAGSAAAQRGHLYTLDADALYRPTGRLVDAAEQLCAQLDAIRP